MKTKPQNNDLGGLTPLSSYFGGMKMKIYLRLVFVIGLLCSFSCFSDGSDLTNWNKEIRDLAIKGEYKTLQKHVDELNSKWEKSPSVFLLKKMDQIYSVVFSNGLESTKKQKFLFSLIESALERKISKNISYYILIDFQSYYLRHLISDKNFDSKICSQIQKCTMVSEFMLKINTYRDPNYVQIPRNSVIYINYPDEKNKKAQRLREEKRLELEEKRRLNVIKCEANQQYIFLEPYVKEFFIKTYKSNPDKREEIEKCLKAGLFDEKFIERVFKTQVEKTKVSNIRDVKNGFENKISTEMKQHLQGILIPEVYFNNATIKDVAILLSELSRRQDVKKQGVKFLVAHFDKRASISCVIKVDGMNLYDVLNYFAKFTKIGFEEKSGKIIFYEKE